MFGLVSRAEDSSIKTPPFSEPFDLSHVGRTIDLKINIQEAGTYSLNIIFYIRRPNKYSYLLDAPETPAEAIKLSKILGSYAETSVPAAFSVRVFRERDNQYILNESTAHLDTNATYMGRYAQIFQVRLDQGRYDIKLEYTQGDPALFGLPAKISLGKSHHGK